jgi:hypothetical protein
VKCIVSSIVRNHVVWRSFDHVDQVLYLEMVFTSRVRQRLRDMPESFHQFRALPHATKLYLASFMDWNGALRLCQTSKANKRFSADYLLSAFRNKWGTRKTVERKDMDNVQYAKEIKRLYGLEMLALEVSLVYFGL